MAENLTTPVTFGILSVLEGEPYRRVKDLQQRLEERYGLVEAQAFEHPHISFQGGTACCLEGITATCHWLLERLEPFTLEASGIGHFTNRVIYLRVKLTPALRQMNRLVNEYLSSRCLSVFPLYTPEQWVPHITLAMGDMSEGVFEEVWRELSRSDLSFAQTIRNLCLASRQDGGGFAIAEQWQLGAGPVGQGTGWPA